MEAGNVFSQDVKLKIHDAPDLEGVKVGVFKSIGDDADLETVGGRLANGEAHAIDSDTALVHREITTLLHLRVEIIFKRKLRAPLLVLHIDAAGGAVDMTLHNVAV